MTSPGAIPILLSGLVAGGLAGAGLAIGWLRRDLRQRGYAQGLLDSTHDAILLLDAETLQILDANAGACRMLKCTREQALKRRWPDFVPGPPEEARAALADRMEKARREGPQTFAWQARRANGDNLSAEVRLLLATIGGRPRGIAALLDVTERKQAESELAESAQRFRTLIDTVPDLAIHGYLMDGTAIYWNETCARLYGYTTDEVLGRNLLDLIIPDELKESVRANIRALKLGAPSLPPGELVLKRKDGSRVHVYSGYAVSSLPGSPPQFFCMDIDLSERIRSEEDRHKLQDQLSHSQKMELVGRLAGGVAHDFNNMLGVIVGYAELAMEQTDATSPVHRHLREIHQAAHRSTALTRQLLAYARKQPVSPKAIDLNVTIAGALTMLQRLLGENLQLHWAPGPAPCPVKMDPSQIDQILTNLCVNARDAIQGRGEITIHTGVTTGVPPAPPLPADLAPGEYAWVSVGDNGPGMPREVLDHIFEPFFTTKGVGKGTGLGLATVDGIVKQNGGYVDVQSVSGHGTTLTIYLPCRREAAGTEPDAPASAADSAGHQTLLLVEDETALLQLCQSSLERLGYSVLATPSPTEALALAHAHPTPIDLLITDVVMPDMDGAELSRQLTQRLPSLKTLFISGYTADVIARHGVLPSGVHFLHKPFANTELAAKVQAVLAAPPGKDTPHG
jgi:two-component system, cell cycle sensor histidine kinase and response regulator CckA